MHGIVFKQLKGHVVEEHGRDAWTEVVEAVEAGRQAYLPVRTYPDEEFTALLSAAADLEGGDERALQRALGVDLGGALADTYGSQIDADWGYFDLLEHVETVHEAAREGGDAEPPHLESERTDETRVEVTYGSDRRLCDVGKGIAEGLAAEYGVDVSVRERSCMHEGGRECELVFEG
jgi:predicted hydrocarbon binding protein